MTKKQITGLIAILAFTLPQAHAERASINFDQDPIAVNTTLKLATEVEVPKASFKTKNTTHLTVAKSASKPYRDLEPGWEGPNSKKCDRMKENYYRSARTWCSDAGGLNDGGSAPVCRASGN